MQGSYLSCRTIQRGNFFSRQIRLPDAAAERTAVQPAGVDTGLGMGITGNAVNVIPLRFGNIEAFTEQKDIAFGVIGFV